MNTKLLAAVLVATTLASPAVSAQSEPVGSDIIDPIEMKWDRLPRSADMQSAWPDEPRRKGGIGQAAILCRVADNRRLTDCEVVAEAPPGQGYGEAALKLARKFQAAKVTKTGRPTVGARVIVRLNWAMFLN